MEAKEWKEKLLTNKKNGYDLMPAEEREAMDRYCQGYKAFLDAGKTERECVQEGIRLAEEKGVPLEVYPLQHYLACGLIQKLADS